MTCSLECPNGSICHAIVGMAHSPKVSACNNQGIILITSLNGIKTIRLETFYSFNHHILVEKPHQPIESKLHVVDDWSIMRGRLTKSSGQHIDNDWICSERSVQKKFRATSSFILQPPPVNSSCPAWKIYFKICRVGRVIFSRAATAETNILVRNDSHTWTTL